jgi:hypothetical protein
LDSERKKKHEKEKDNQERRQSLQSMGWLVPFPSTNASELASSYSERSSAPVLQIEEKETDKPLSSKELEYSSLKSSFEPSSSHRAHSTFKPRSNSRDFERGNGIIRDKLDVVNEFPTLDEGEECRLVLFE